MVLAVAGAYLQTIATDARVVSQRAQVDNAQAVYHQAEVRREAGTNARIDVTRTLVELQGQQQRLNALQSDVLKQKLALARLIGLPLDRELILSEPLSFNPPPRSRSRRRRAAGFPEALGSESRRKPGPRRRNRGFRRARRTPALRVTVTADYGVLGPSSGFQSRRLFGGRAR